MTRSEFASPTARIPTMPKKDVALVVDDSPDMLSLLSEALDHADITVLVALEGQQALTIAQNITPDIILLDALMPGMDGFETCRRLKSLPDLAHIPVIFMTGLSDTQSTLRGLEAGGVDYITKPINNDELTARMRVHLSNARMTLSARHALDNTGQYLLAANRQGHLLWATPQAHHLFEHAAIEVEALSAQLAPALTQMIKPEYNRERLLQLPQATTPLGIQYIGQTDSDEYLLRLVDLERPSDSEQLKAAFHVTQREAEVLLWIAHGKTNREIGVILSMSPRTVNKHLQQIFRKLNVENRTSAAAMALKILAT